MKPGYKTTEFWMAMAATVIGSVHASGLLVDDSIESKVVGFLVAGLASLGYSVSRGVAKHKQKEP